MSESNDLSEVLPAKVRRLNANLTRWLRITRAKLPRPNPEYDPKANLQKANSSREKRKNL